MKKVVIAVVVLVIAVAVAVYAYRAGVVPATPVSCAKNTEPCPVGSKWGTDRTCFVGGESNLCMTLKGKEEFSVMRVNGVVGEKMQFNLPCRFYDLSFTVHFGDGTTDDLAPSATPDTLVPSSCERRMQYAFTTPGVYEVFVTAGLLDTTIGRFPAVTISAK